MAEALSADAAHERLLAGVDARVLFEVVFELERFAAVRTSESAQFGRLARVAHHVSLKPVHVGERLATYAARLRNGGRCCHGGGGRR